MILNVKELKNSDKSYLNNSKISFKKIQNSNHSKTQVLGDNYLNLIQRKAFTL